jgi:hypothetical protein
MFFLPAWASEESLPWHSSHRPFLFLKGWILVRHLRNNGSGVRKHQICAVAGAALRERGLAPSRQTATGLRSENCPFQYG